MSGWWRGSKSGRLCGFAFVLKLGENSVLMSRVQSPPNLPMRRMPEGVVGADSPKYNRSLLSGDVIYGCPRIRSEFDLILEYWRVDRWGE